MVDTNPFVIARKSGLNIPDWLIEGIDPALAASFLPGAGVYDSRQMGEQMAEQRRLNNYGTAALLGLGAAGMAASEFLPGVLGASARKGIKSGVGLLPAPEPVLALPAPQQQMLLPPPKDSPFGGQPTEIIPSAPSPAVVEQPVVPEVVPTYRSRLEPAIEAMPQEKMTAQQAQGHFAKFPGGVGADELEFTGVQGLLDQGQPVTKSGLLQQARSQKLEIDDVVLKSDDSVAPQEMNWGDPEIDTSYENYSHRAEDMEYDINNYGDSQFPYYLDYTIESMKKKSPDYDDVWEAGIRDHFKSGKQLDDLPGNVEQDIHDTLTDIAEEEYLNNPYVSVYDSETGYEIYGNDEFGYQIRNPNGDDISPSEVYNLEEAKIQAYADALDSDILGSGEGATRFKDYALPGGDDYQEMLLTLPNPNYVGLQKTDFLSSHFDEPNILAHGRYDTRQIDGDKTYFIQEIQSDWHQQGRKRGYNIPEKKRVIKLSGFDNRIRLGGEGPPVPDAPFKATEKWSGLTFDRMLKEAIDGGHDRIAWTPGQMQAERYGLSRKLDTLRVEKLRHGTKTGQYVLSGSKDGRGANLEKVVPEKSLPDFIGKELSDKVIKDAPQYPDGKDYTGVDLEIGGEGMKAFYDKVIKKHATKLAKKHGSKVEIKDIDTGSGTQQVWSMKITPEMKKAMAGGVTLGGAAVLPGLLQERNQNQQPNGLLNY